MNLMASPGEGILVEANCLIRQSFHHPLFVRRPLKCFGSWNHRKYATISAYLIFVTKFTNETCGEKFVMWRNFRFQISKYDRNGEIWSFSTYGEISPPLACVWCGECLHIYVKFILFCCTIVFVTIYDVLSLNMFCCDSCTFVWRKFNQKLHMWWKSDKFGPLLPRV